MLKVSNMITYSYHTFLYAENHLEGKTENKSDVMFSAVFVFEKVKARIENITSGPRVCFVLCVCTVKMPDRRL